MELRQLTTDIERQIFAQCLTEARATRGYGVRDTSRSMLSKAHIQFANLYALFENEGAPAEQMVGGFTAHDLATLPQTYPKPDVSHLPPRYVIEGGELWSLARGMGRIAHHIAAVVVGLLQAKAVIVYPIIEPEDRATQHLRLGFVPACEKIKFPFGETIDGGAVWVQPLILEGEPLERYIGAGFDFMFHAMAGVRPLLSFDREIAKQGPRREVAPQPARAEEKPTPNFGTPQAGGGEERNGANAH